MCEWWTAADTLTQAWRESISSSIIWHLSLPLVQQQWSPSWRRPVNSHDASLKSEAVPCPTQAQPNRENINKGLRPQARLVVREGAGPQKFLALTREKHWQGRDPIFPSCFPHLALQRGLGLQAAPQGYYLQPLTASWPVDRAHSSWILGSHSPVQKRCTHQGSGWKGEYRA